MKVSGDAGGDSSATEISCDRHRDELLSERREAVVAEELSFFFNDDPCAAGRADLDAVGVGGGINAIAPGPRTVIAGLLFVVEVVVGGAEGALRSRLRRPRDVVVGDVGGDRCLLCCSSSSSMLTLLDSSVERALALDKVRSRLRRRTVRFNLRHQPVILACQKRCVNGFTSRRCLTLVLALFLKLTC